MRTIVIILLSLLLLIMGGCTQSNIPNNKGQEKPQTIPQLKDQSVALKPSTNKEADKIQVVEANKDDEGLEVTESDKITGWKKLKASVSLSELTEHGSQPIYDNKKVGFSLHYPGSWTMSYNVFYDGNKKKVAEIPPAILLQSGQESVFLDYEHAIDQGEELISREEIQVNSYKGSKTITKISTESGPWYPHIYRLTNETHGFVINFYSRVINTEEQALFDRIVGTFNFEQ